MLNYKKISIYLFFLATLFLGLYFQENSSGGAKIDFFYLYKNIENFSLSLELGFSEFYKSKGNFVHSPVHYILSGFLLNIFENITIVKSLYLLVCSSIPIIFYLILKNKYLIENDNIFYLSCIIFFSPFFRSSGIWLLGDNLSIIFFSLSVLFFNKTQIKNHEFLNYYLCIFFLFLCCYVRYYYSLFFIFYFLSFYKKIPNRIFLNLLLESFILSIPIIIYFYNIIFNYSFFTLVESKISINYLKNSIVILSLVLFYILPFILFEIKKIFFKQINFNRKYFFIIFLSFLLIYVIDINLDKKFLFNDQYSLGGGVFVKLFSIINLNISLLMILTAFISLIILDYLFDKNRTKNYLILITLILSFPVNTFYQKYSDPLFIIIFLGLISSDRLSNLIKNEKINIKFIILYFFLFYVFSTMYYS